MVIAIYFNITAADKQGMTYGFLHEVFSTVANIHPEHKFVFISNKQTVILPPANDIIAVEILAAQGAFSLFDKYSASLQSVLKKHKAGIVIYAFPSFPLKKTVPQIVIAFQENLQNKKMSRILNLASSVIVLQSSLKQIMADRFEIPVSKFHLVDPAAGEFYTPMDAEQRECIKTKYSEEKEFFLCRTGQADEERLINVLKAFSHFKKRQQSNMKMLIHSYQELSDSFHKSLATYKYRDDIKLTERLSAVETAQLTAAAYAVIVPSESEDSVLISYQAMQSGVPLIHSENMAAQFPAGNTLPVDINDPKLTAEKLMLVYTDEKLRAGLIESGLKTAGQYNFQKTTEQVYKIIEDVVA